MRIESFRLYRRAERRGKNELVLSEEVHSLPGRSRLPYRLSVFCEAILRDVEEHCTFILRVLDARNTVADIRRTERFMSTSKGTHQILIETQFLVHDHGPYRFWLSVTSPISQDSTIVTVQAEDPAIGEHDRHRV